MVPQMLAIFGEVYLGQARLGTPYTEALQTSCCFAHLQRSVEESGSSDQAGFVIKVSASWHEKCFRNSPVSQRIYRPEALQSSLKSQLIAKRGS